MSTNLERQETLTSQTITGTDTALTDTLDDTPKSNASVLLTLNGEWMEQGAGKAYTVSGSTITWLASSGTAPDMTTSDRIVVYYVTGSGNETEVQEAVAAQSVTDTDTTLTAELTSLPKDPNSVRLALNGSPQALGPGKDYVIDGKKIVWLASTGTAENITASDVILVYYVTGAGLDYEREQDVTSETVTDTDTLLADLMDNSPKNPASVWLVKDGLVQQPGWTNDYLMEGSKIRWFASSGNATNLTTGSKLYAFYKGVGGIAT